MLRVLSNLASRARPEAEVVDEKLGCSTALRGRLPRSAFRPDQLPRCHVHLASEEERQEFFQQGARLVSQLREPERVELRERGNHLADRTGHQAEPALASTALRTVAGRSSSAVAALGTAGAMHAVMTTLKAVPAMATATIENLPSTIASIVVP